MVTIKDGGGLDTGSIAAGIGFGEGKGGIFVAAGNLGQVFLFQRIAAGNQNRIGAQGVGGIGGGNADATTPELLKGEDHVKTAAAETTVLLGDIEPEKVGLGNSLQDIAGELFLLIQARPAAE